MLLEGVVCVVVGTDAPFTPDEIKRIVRRVSLGMGRMGSIHGNGSGDIFIAFSTANSGADGGNSTPPDRAAVSSVQRLIGARIRRIERDGVPDRDLERRDLAARGARPGGGTNAAAAVAPPTDCEDGADHQHLA